MYPTIQGDGGLGSTLGWSVATANSLTAEEDTPNVPAPLLNWFQRPTVGSDGAPMSEISAL